MNNLIGFFDSGAGGISVLHSAHRLLPNENLLFFGDNRNAPYGSRPLDEIRRLTRAGIDRLLARDVKAIVIACNTATSAYADILREELTIPVIGMEPAIKPAQLSRHGGEVLALATKATLSLPKFQRLMALYGEGVIPIVGEGLVELVESGQAGSPAADDALERLLKPYLSRSIDAIVLGCTHYPFLAPSIRRLFPHAAIFDGREGTVLQLKRRLEQRGMLSDCASPGLIELTTSGDTHALDRMHSLMRALDALPESE